MLRRRSRGMVAISPWIFLIVVMVGSIRGHAEIAFLPVSAEELQMTSDPKAAGASAIILYRQLDRDDSRTTGRFDSSYSIAAMQGEFSPPQLEDNYFRIKILSEAGRKYADIEIPIPFLKNSAELSGVVSRIRARTISPSGLVVDFDGKILEKTITKADGEKYRAKTFTVPGVQVGSMVEYIYTTEITGHYIQNSHWIISNELFTKKAKFSLRSFNSGVSEASLRWSWHGLQVPPKRDKESTVRLELDDIPAFLTEDYMPPQDEMKKRVDFVYTNDSREKDAANYWKKVGKRWNTSVELFIDKPKVMEHAVSEICSLNDTPAQKAEKIYARVQQLRNTSYEIKRKEDKSLQDVEEVWTRGYGSGMQLTWLYLALARAAGIEAYGGMVSDRKNYFLDPKLMEGSKLNANVVLLRLNGQDVYCDPGAAYAPFGLLPWDETGVSGLRLDKNGGSWISTTLPESNVSRIERKATLKLISETGGVEGKLTVTYTGLEAFSRRVEERNENEATRKKFLEDEVKASIPMASEVELVTQPEWKSSTLPLVAEFKLKVPGWATVTGRGATLNAAMFTAAEKHLFDHPTRTYPIYFQYPNTRLDDVWIELPDGWQATSLPSKTNRDLKLVSYLLQAENDKEILHLSRKLSTDILLLDVKHYASLQNFYRMVRTNDEQQIVVGSGVEAASK